MTIGELIGILEDGANRCGFNQFNSDGWSFGSVGFDQSMLRTPPTGVIDRSIFTNGRLQSECWWSSTQGDVQYSSLDGGI